MMLTHGTHNANLNQPGAIKADGGVFGAILFFTCEKSAPFGKHEFRIDADKLNIAETYNVKHDDGSWDIIAPIVELRAKVWGVDVDTAFDLIVEDAVGWTALEDWDADKQWDCQRALGECAIALGYDGVECFDENGTVYMVNMIGREAELVPATDENWF